MSDFNYTVNWFHQNFTDNFIMLKKSNLIKYLTKIIRLFLFLIIYSSCSSGIYNPNSLNTPMLIQKNNTKLNLAVGTSGFDLQTAYAVTNQIGIMANGAITNYDAHYSDFKLLGISHPTDEKHRETFGELGIGFFSKKDTATTWRWEIYGGYGEGKTIQTMQTDGTLVFQSPYQKYFFQPALGNISGEFEFIWAFRYSYLTLGEIDWIGNVSNRRTIATNVLEPSFTARRGWKNIKFFYQISAIVSSDLGTTIKLVDPHTLPIRFQIGVNVSLNN